VVCDTATYVGLTQQHTFQCFAQISDCKTACPYKTSKCGSCYMGENILTLKSIKANWDNARIRNSKNAHF
jgi:hypothetical protein